MPLIKFNSAGSIVEAFGTSGAAVASLASGLEQSRRQFLAEFDQGDRTFFGLPMHQYQAYQDVRETSPLGQVFDVGTSLQDQIDAVVVVGTRQGTAAAKAIFWSCCDPYHNELSRADRGSRPRMYFAGDSFDNDALAALIHRLEQRDFRDSPAESKLAMILIDSDDSSDATAMAQASLASQLGDDRHLIFPITLPGSKLDQNAASMGCERVFHLPPDLPIDQRTLSSTALLPAAMLGLDCIKLLEGAVMMNDHFRTAAFDANEVLQFVAVHHQIAQSGIFTDRRLHAWQSSLKWLPDWYEHLRRDWGHSADEAKSLVTHLVADEPRYDPLSLGDGPEASAAVKMAQEIEAARVVDRQAGRPTAELRLPTVDIRVVGQLFQMLMIATKIEANLPPSPALPFSE